MDRRNYFCGDLSEYALLCKQIRDLADREDLNNEDAKESVEALFTADFFKYVIPTHKMWDSFFPLKPAGLQGLICRLDYHVLKANSRKLDMASTLVDQIKQAVDTAYGLCVDHWNPPRLDHIIARVQTLQAIIGLCLEELVERSHPGEKSSTQTLIDNTLFLFAIEAVWSQNKFHCVITHYNTWARITEGLGLHLAAAVPDSAPIRSEPVPSRTHGGFALFALCLPEVVGSREQWEADHIRELSDFLHVNHGFNVLTLLQPSRDHLIAALAYMKREAINSDHYPEQTLFFYYGHGDEAGNIYVQGQPLALTAEMFIDNRTPTRKVIHSLIAKHCCFASQGIVQYVAREDGMLLFAESNLKNLDLRFKLVQEVLTDAVMFASTPNMAPFWHRPSVQLLAPEVDKVHNWPDRKRCMALVLRDSLEKLLFRFPSRHFISASALADQMLEDSELPIGVRDSFAGDTNWRRFHKWEVDAFAEMQVPITRSGISAENVLNLVNYDPVSCYPNYGNPSFYISTPPASPLLQAAKPSSIGQAATAATKPTFDPEEEEEEEDIGWHT